jgi:hypothetical protein
MGKKKQKWAVPVGRIVTLAKTHHIHQFRILRRFRIRHMFHLQKTLGLNQPANHEVSKLFPVRHTQEAKILKRNVRLNSNHH